MNNYWLIPMDFRTCDYKQMEEEWTEKKKIMWQAPGTPEYKKGEWIVKGSMVEQLKKGDIVYFYITHLPSESKDNLSRIMLRGKIDDEPYPIEKNKVYKKSKDTTMINGFSIVSITTLYKERLENNLFLSLKDLRKRDENFIYPQGKNWPDKRYKYTLSNNMINILEECFKSSIHNNDFKELINHFNKKCFFCGKDENNHRTFTSRNGLDYYEYHHFIPKYKAKEFPELKDIIDSPTNGLSLCSNCHNKIHYGTIEDVKIMLKKVLEDNEINRMLESSGFQKIIGENKNTFKWFQEAYNIKEDK